MLPKIHVYTILRNEEKILPWFLRHYSEFAERIYIFDDFSDDKTAEIADACEKSIRIPFRTSGIDDIMFADMYSRLYHGMSRGKADWVMCVDTDEFIYHKALPWLLMEYKREGVKVVKADAMQMTAGSWPDLASGKQLHELVCTGFPDGRYSKPCVFDPSIDITFHPGRHGATYGENKANLTGEVKLLHYRYFGVDSIKERNSKNAARLTSENVKRSMGTHNKSDNQGQYSPEWWSLKAKEGKSCLG